MRQVCTLLTGASPSMLNGRSATMSGTFARAFPKVEPARRLRGNRVAAHGQPRWSPVMGTRTGRDAMQSHQLACPCGSPCTWANGTARSAVAAGDGAAVRIVAHGVGAAAGVLLRLRRVPVQWSSSSQGRARFLRSHRARLTLRESGIGDARQECIRVRGARCWATGVGRRCDADGERRAGGRPCDGVGVLDRRGVSKIGLTSGADAHGIIAEPSRAEPSRAEPSRAEPSRAEPSRYECARVAGQRLPASLPV